MRVTMLALLLAGCPASSVDDTGETGDPEPAGPVALDEILAGEPDAVWGCGWAYVVAEYDAATIVLDLALPEADRFADADVSYTRALGPDDTVRVGTGLGPDDLDVFDCSDVVEVMQGVEVYTGTAGDLALDATFVREAPEWTCDGTSANPLYDTRVVVTDLKLADARGELATLSTFAADVHLADYCGG